MLKNRSPRILLIDNDEHVRDALKIFFDNSDVEFLVFQSAGEGLNSLKYQQVDMVISDYFLPDMSGVDFLKAVAGAYPEVKRVLMATIVSEQLHLEILNAGIDQCIEKPLTVGSLDTIINRFNKDV